AAGVTGLGEELLGALGIVGRHFPVLAEALVKRVVPVHEGRLGAHALPERVDDRLLVDGEVERQPDLPRVLLALRVLGITGPRARRAVILAIGRGLALQDHPVTRGVRRLVNAEPCLLRLIEVVAEYVADVDLAGPEPGQARRRIGDASDDELLEGGRLAPVVRDRLAPVVVAPLAVPVPVGRGDAGTR